MSRVNARIGSSAAGDGDFFAGNFFPRFLQRLLNRRRIFLALPAAVVRSIVGDGEFQSSHRGILTSDCQRF